jgi:RecG-like helicase
MKMKINHLKLIFNNKNKIGDIFFNKKELQLILNLYAGMVSGGEWKDYGLSISKREVSFNVYRRSSEFPVYKITKNLKPKSINEKYLIKDAKNKIIKNSENLQDLISKIIWKKFKLVN